MFLKVNLKRWLLAGLAAFVTISVLDFIAHGILLMPLYKQTSTVWRGTDSLYWLMHAGALFFSFVFVRIYMQGYEERREGLGQGLRYGLLIGLLGSVSYIGIWYVVLPVPLSLALGWAASSMVDCLLAGAVVGLIYRP